jgi:acyl dehydratase
MKTFDGIDDLTRAIGTHLGYSSWITVDQERIDTFARATGDHQWIHVDPARAADGPFGSTIAHGYLTLSLLPTLSWEIFSVRGLAMEINYGTDKVRFPAPVPVGSSLRAGVELIAVDESGPGFMSRTKVVIEREDGDKPVCIADCLGYLVAA